ncbi:MAG: Mov34/MPN/PAD-1 family protein [Candidatus Thermoplasmatota archaeon]|nr:Mov34/MPN/PAD-1 family protein [Candidatus Thermoplasmatota archaeon]
MGRIWGIERSCIDLIKESARSVYPKEFAGLLSVGEDKGIISEVVLLPGTISGDSHAIFQLHMAPVDYSIVGTVHSHPSPYPTPSDADLHLFEKYGKVHIIVARPYDDNSWKAYNFKGKDIKLEVVE